MTELPTFPAPVASPLVRSIAFVIGGMVQAALAVPTLRSVVEHRVSDVDLRPRMSKPPSSAPPNAARHVVLGTASRRAGRRRARVAEAEDDLGA